MKTMVESHFQMLAALQDQIVKTLTEAGVQIKRVGHMAGNILIMDFSKQEYQKAQTTVENLRAAEPSILTRFMRISFFDKKKRIVIIIQ